MLTAIALCLASLAQPPADRPAGVRGTVVERGTNRPLAGVSIRLADDFDGQAVTTDAQGRFEGLPAPPADGVPPGVRRSGPRARIRAEDDRAWPWTLANEGWKPGGRSEGERRRFLQVVYEEEVPTWWEAGKEGATLTAECPPIGVVEAVVRDPDGRPLADAPIVVVPLTSRNRTRAVRFSGRTDGAGAFRLRSFAGAREFGVVAVGVGLGSTGRIEVRGGETIRPEMPPLGRFARIEGRLDDGSKGPGATAVLTLDSPFGVSPIADAPCDETGRFVFPSVPPGDHRVWIKRDGGAVANFGRDVHAAPGQTIRDAVVTPPRPWTPDEQRALSPFRLARGRDRSRTVVRVEGTVRDERGEPVADAAVYVHGVYSPSNYVIPSQDVEKTTTDRRGRFRLSRVEGSLQESRGTLTALVVAEGRPPMLAHAPGPDVLVVDPEAYRPARLDVVLGPRGSGGTVAVAAVRDGRPAPETAVFLTTAATSRIFPDLERDWGSPAMNEMRARAVPEAVAGADGVARFHDVPPGVYDAVAPPTVVPETVKIAAAPRIYPIQGTAAGIVVPPGGRVMATVDAPSSPASARFLLLGPDGAPVARRDVWVVDAAGRLTPTPTVSTDERGEYTIRLDLGPWDLDLRYTTDPRAARSTDPITEGPYYQARVQVLVSPAVATPQPIVARAVRREPGSIKARLLGPDGAPARGGVMVLGDSGRASLQAGTVDDQGWVRFAGVPSGTRRVRGAVDGQASAARPRYRARRDGDDALTGQTTIFDREVTVEAGAETVVELRPEPVGYLRATVRPPAGRSASDYEASVEIPELLEPYPVVEIADDKSNYLFGPLRGGRRTLVVAAKRPGRAETARVEVEANVEPGRVVRVDVDAPTPPERPDTLYPPSDTDPLDATPITVVLPDGATPALGAQALFIPAGRREPAATGTADAVGRLGWMEIEQTTPAGLQAPEPASGPTTAGPTVVAWALEGGGATVAVIRPGEPLRLVLPPSTTAAGRVTIGGAAVADRDARLRVAIVPEEQGALAAALRRETTADAEGRFRLVGLVPGRYVVQASRDDVWTSKPVPLAVEPGKDATIDLDVPAPGATIALKLVDRQGTPIAADYSIRRGDAGPLGGRSPLVGRGDDRGEAVVRGLAAGVFEMTVADDPEPHPLDVPPARPGAGPLDVRVEVSRRGP